ncbi:MAG TPA: SUMF1/EgtB/PvdO family nonheme iron enzyme [Chitinophagaceae bacterium]|nr:SUMF1/EgtB/PvdO family nonheme iron enzyme [Chitinophagaceae bacterium]
MLCRTFLLLLLLQLSSVVIASDISVTGIEWLRDPRAGEYGVKFTVSWNNSWNNSRNFDAAWIFIKYQSPSYGVAGYRHAKVLAGNHEMLVNHVPGSPAPVFDVPADRNGLYLYASSPYRGNISWTIQLALDTAILSDRNFAPNNRLISVHAIEMVHIPAGAFTLGDPDTAAYRNYSLFASDGNGRPGGLYKIASEKIEIPVGTVSGNLYYHAEVPIYHGDRRGPVPADFPKGFQAFYIMKYELQQGQYAEFLNCISASASDSRANFGGKLYYENRGSIKFENGRYVAGSPQRPCNYVSWDDACAFADWAALRPMTELEFEKACRGTRPPIAHEYPWNTATKKNLQRLVHTNNELIFLNNLRESSLNDNNRDQFGASYYWVMDLAGSLWERCVTIGDSTGRQFKGTHGDGMLAPYGLANNADWPKGSTETSGFGFRGGGYYEHNMQYGGFNPHSPVGYRNFGSWPGGARSVAYSSRFVRTADAR